jgi:fatty acid desaturase
MDAERSGPKTGYSTNYWPILSSERAPHFRIKTFSEQEWVKLSEMKWKLWFSKFLTFPFVVFVVAGCIVYVLAVVVSFIVVFLYCICALFVCNVCYLSVLLLYYCHRAKAQLHFNKYIYKIRKGRNWSWFQRRAWRQDRLGDWPSTVI